LTFFTYQGFHPSIIAPPKHLHLTVVMFKLFSDEDVNKVCQKDSNSAKIQAKQILADASPKMYDILQTRSCLVKLQGNTPHDSGPITFQSLRL
jgi:hypothetical protein